MALGNGERYYSPSYARFIQQDSFAGIPNVPQSLNRFSYVHNNPTKHTDPSGNIVPVLILIGLGAGILLGGGYSYASQRAKIADGTMREEDFSWENVIESAGWGGLTAGIGLAVAAAAPITIPIMIGAGIVIGGKQIVDGAGLIGAGKTNEGGVEIAFGTINLALSLLGARSYIKAKIPLARETQPTQKLLGDGGAGNRKLLNAAPEEVVNPTKKTRFIVDESGNTKDLSTGRGNQNKIGRSEKPIELEPSNRFEELAVDPQTKTKLPKSIEEAETIMNAEADNLVSGSKRPNLSKGEPNLDFKITDGYADVKTPRPSPFRTLVQQAKDVARSVQKYDKSVKVLVEMKYLNPKEIIQFKKDLLNNVKNSDNILFVNDK